MTTLDVKIQAALVDEETDVLVKHMKEDNLRLQFILDLADASPDYLDIAALQEQARIISTVSRLDFNRW